jgi:hypothetical protein
MRSVVTIASLDGSNSFVRLNSHLYSMQARRSYAGDLISCTQIHDFKFRHHVSGENVALPIAPRNTAPAPGSACLLAVIKTQDVEVHAQYTAFQSGNSNSQGIVAVKNVSVVASETCLSNKITLVRKTKTSTTKQFFRSVL